MLGRHRAGIVGSQRWQRHPILLRRSGDQEGGVWVEIQRVARTFLGDTPRPEIFIFADQGERDTNAGVWRWKADIRREWRTEDLPVRSSTDINFSEFDRTFDNIFILKNYEVFEKICVGNADAATLSITFEEKVKRDSSKQLALSSDGTVCAIGSDQNAEYFYLINLRNQTQQKAASKVHPRIRHVSSTETQR